MKKIIEKKKPEIHRGFISLEIMGALVVVALAALLGAEKYSEYLDEQEWGVAARHASQFNEASKQYIADHRDELLLNQPLPYRITPSLLIKNGYLQPGFAEKNSLGQQYVTGVVKSSQKNAPALQALTCSVQGETLSEKGMRRISAQINGMGGFVDEKNIANGAYGGWTSQPRDFGLDCRHGHIAMALSSEILGSVLQESDRLYRFQVKHRPELNRMHTHIDMGGNDITHSGRINASGNITTTGTVRGGTVQLDQISISGHRCTPDGLLSRDASGALLSCQSGVWKGAVGGNLSRAGVNALSVESTGDFHFVLVSISSRFFAVDGSHTAMANFTLSLNGRVREQITNRLNVRKTGGGGHYWGYETVGVVQKQYRLTIAQGDHLRVALSSAHYHLSSDIRIDLSN